MEFKSEIQTLQMSYLISAVVWTEWMVKVMENLFMSDTGKEIHCEVVEVVKCRTLKWFGHQETNDKEDIEE